VGVFAKQAPGLVSIEVRLFHHGFTRFLPVFFCFLPLIQVFA
jgi:hypothetical protein